MSDDLPPPLPGYHRDRPGEAGSFDTADEARIEVATPVVIFAMLIVLLGLSALIPLIIMLWEAAL